MNELILHKPNQLIEVIGSPLSNLGLVTYNYILHKLQTQKEKTNFIRLSLAELSTDINRNSYAYEDVYEVLKNLLGVKIVSIDKRGKSWGGFVLLSAFKKEKDYVYIEVPSIIINELLKQEDLYYTTIKLLEEKTFKCVYSIIFYEIFKKYEKVEIPCYSIDVLRSLTETTEKYKVYADFKKRVIVPAIKEINKFNNKYIYDYEEEYLGRKVYKIRFTKILKETKEPQLSLPNNSSKIIPSEKLVLAITKAKSNIYISRKYRQTTINKAIKQFGEELVIAGLNKLSSFNKEITSFSALLNSAITEIKAQREFEDLANLKTIKKEEVITPAPAVEVLKSIERETITESEFEKRYKQFLEEKQVEDTEHTRICYRFAFNIIKD